MPIKNPVRPGDWFQRKDGAKWYRKVLAIQPRLSDYEYCSYATVIPADAQAGATSVSITAASPVYTCPNWGRPVTEDEVRQDCLDLDAALKAAIMEYRQRNSELESTILHVAIRSAPTEMLEQEIMRREAHESIAKK